MKWKRTALLILAYLTFAATNSRARTQQPEPSANVISGTVAAIGYPVGGGAITVT